MQDVPPLPLLAWGPVFLLLLLLSVILPPAAAVRRHGRAAGVTDDPTKGGATKAQAVVQDVVCL